MRLRRRLARGVLGLALLTGLFMPAPAAAVDPVPGTPVPAEPEAFVLPLPVTDAIVADLGGLGEALLVVTGSDAGQGLASVQAWSVGPVELGGSAVGYGNKVPLRRSASVDELLAGRGRLGIDADDMIKVRMNEPAKFLVVQREGRDVVLVATIGTDTDFDVDCCLTIWEVSAGGGSLELRLVAETQRFAAELIAADMDADGTDELLVTEGPLNDNSDVLDVSLLRWNEDRFARTGFTIPTVASCCSAILDAGETDGAPGEEVLVTGSAPGVASGLLRVTLHGETPVVERAEVGQVLAARALSLESGPALVTADGSILFLWSWPRDGQAERQAARTSGGEPSAVFGTGAETRIVTGAAFPDPGSVLVLPGDLGGGVGPSVVFGRDTRPGAFAGRVLGDDPFTPTTRLTPYFGVIPGGLPGASDVYVFGGRSVSPVSDPDVLAEVAALALLPGLEPVGTVGPAGAWVALLTEFSGFEIRGPAVPMLFARAPGMLRLVATASLVTPEVDGGHLAPRFLGVAPDPDHPTGLIVGDEAADAEITGPPGTSVWWSTRGELGDLTIGPSGVARIRLLDEAGPDAPEGSGATVNIWLVTPAGHAYAGAWRIRVYRQPPSLAITTDDALVNFSPSVSGQTVPGATVTINGVPAEVTATGRFGAPVTVGFLPTDVRVVAVDPVGNRTERVVSMVWPVDYRRLPFVPFAVLLTVAAAAVLFLRRPDAGPSRRTPDDGATFEEIGG